jgi:hypothetical protein
MTLDLSEELRVTLENIEAVRRINREAAAQAVSTQRGDGPPKLRVIEGGKAHGRSS